MNRLFAALILSSVALSAADPRTDYVPQTSSDRWHFYLVRSYGSPEVLLSAAVGGLISQASNEPKEWGGGMQGYGQRVASSFGVSIVQESIHSAGAAVLGLDSRYQPCQCKGFFPRTKYSLVSVFTSYDHDGHRRFDPTQVVGAYGAGMISILWYPSRYDPLVKGVQEGHLRVGVDAAYNFYQEFKPELTRKLKFWKK